MGKDKLRKLLVGVFIAIGLGGIVYSQTRPEPKTYEGQGDGYNDVINVKIVAKRNSKGEIRVLKVESTHDDTPALAGPALEKLMAETLVKQTWELDAVSGATYTSEGYMDALKDAMKKVEN